MCMCVHLWVCVCVLDALMSLRVCVQLRIRRPRLNSIHFLPNSGKPASLSPSSCDVLSPNPTHLPESPIHPWINPTPHVTPPDGEGNFRVNWKMKAHWAGRWSPPMVGYMYTHRSLLISVRTCGYVCVCIGVSVCVHMLEDVCAWFSAPIYQHPPALGICILSHCLCITVPKTKFSVLPSKR